ncbi:Protein ECM7 [Madurella mycetomatis]|uniref:Protein ECM7 n=1 Tax=Madurella mycetomatis TaxID=100816 RepID=A0A175W6N0_9PEZI|nr:Protein ECM7 [Madurella mycetomatis]
MARDSNLSRLIPVFCSLAAFILVMLALLAGNSPGVLENYDIISVNTSGLGKNLVDRLSSDAATPTQTTDDFCDSLGSFLGKACDSATSAVASAESSIADNLNDIGNDIADRLADELDIRDFYSLHALRICEGDFNPDGRRNVTECHSGFAEQGFSIPSLLTQTITIDIGPLFERNLSLADLGLTQDIESALDSLNSLLKAFTIIFAIGVGFTGLSLLASVAEVVLRNHGSGLLWSNLVIASLAVLFVVLGGLVATIGARVAEGKINDLGESVGLSAVAGTGWVILVWIGAGLMVVVCSYWAWATARMRRARKAADAEGRKPEMDMRRKDGLGQSLASRAAKRRAK